MACDTSTTITAEDLQTFKPNLVFINDVASTEDLTATSPSGVDVKTVGGWQNEFALAVAAVGWQPEIPYASGIYFADTDFNKLVGYLDNSYSPIASQLPFTTSGDWSVDQFKFKQVNSNVISVNGETGAVTIELSDLNGVPQTRTINGKSLASNISLNLADVGFTGDADANFYEHPSFTSYSVTTSGFEFISRIVTNGEGHVQIVEKRSFDANDISAVPSDASSVIEAGTNTTLTIKSADEGASELKVIGDSQGNGRVFVGQSATTGGGINYDGSGLEDYTGSGADYTSLYRVNNGSVSWTAKNSSNSNDWIFRSDIYANETDLVLTTENINTSITLADLGYTGDLNANDYEHPTYTAQNVSTTGLEVISEVVTNGEGHVTDVAKRTINAVPSDASSTIDAGTNTTLTILSDDDGESVLNLRGNDQGSGRIFMGQTPVVGGGIEYHGDAPVTGSGAGDHYLALYTAHHTSGVQWTARNSNQSLDWEFRGDLYTNENKKVYSTNNITSGTAIPTGGNDDDIYIQLDS